MAGQGALPRVPIRGPLQPRAGPPAGPGDGAGVPRADRGHGAQGPAPPQEDGEAGAEAADHPARRLGGERAEPRGPLRRDRAAHEENVRQRLRLPPVQPPPRPGVRGHPRLRQAGRQAAPARGGHARHIAHRHGVHRGGDGQVQAGAAAQAAGPAPPGGEVLLGPAGGVCQGDALHPAALPLRGLQVHAQGGPAGPLPGAPAHRHLARVQGAHGGAHLAAGGAPRAPEGGEAAAAGLLRAERRGQEHAHPPADGGVARQVRLLRLLHHARAARGGAERHGLPLRGARGHGGGHRGGRLRGARGGARQPLRHLQGVPGGGGGLRQEPRPRRGPAGGEEPEEGGGGGGAAVRDPPERGGAGGAAAAAPHGERGDAARARGRRQGGDGGRLQAGPLRPRHPQRRRRQGVRVPEGGGADGG
mmetsp:Transcript_5722/g.11683  ORF Transcript_5722/g.11683 Transcript_5722/m.11683 type:complete len:417 (-) Transcript_5722:232-1482(-)